MQRTTLLLTLGTLGWVAAPLVRAAEPTAAATPAGQATAAATAPSAAAASGAAGAPAAPGAADAIEDKFLRQQGYKPEIRKGIRYYCRREAPLGSRFEQTVCLTAEQSRDNRQHSKEMTERAQRLQSNPAKG